MSHHRAKYDVDLLALLDKMPESKKETPEEHESLTFAKVVAAHAEILEMLMDTLRERAKVVAADPSVQLLSTCESSFLRACTSVLAAAHSANADTGVAETLAERLLKLSKPLFTKPQCVPLLGDVGGEEEEEEDDIEASLLAQIEATS